MAQQMRRCRPWWVWVVSMGCVALPRFRAGRDRPLAGDPRLAEAAAGGGDIVEFTHSFGHLSIDIGPAPGLVVPPFTGDGPHRAAADAGAAGPLPVPEAVVPVVGVGPGGCREAKVGDDRAEAVGDPLGGDQGVVQAEGAEPGGVGGMPLRPGGGDPHGGVIELLPGGGELGGDGPVALAGEPGNHMPSKGAVELLTKTPGFGPLPGGDAVLFPVALPGRPGDGERPADDRGRLPRLTLGGRCHQFPRGQVKVADDPFVVGEERVVNRGKADQRVVEVAFSALREAVRRAFGGKAANFVYDCLFHGGLQIHSGTKIQKSLYHEGTKNAK